MTFTISVIAIPIIMTLILLAIMFRPIKSQSSGPFPFELLEGLFRLGWLIPIFFIWIIYLSYGWYNATHQTPSPIISESVQ